jgi:exportin-1
MIMDSIAWSFKHTMRDIGEVGLNICIELMNNFSKCNSQLSNQFFQEYYINILQDTFFVLTSTSHKSGFKLQSIILMNIFQLVESNIISVPLYDSKSGVSNNTEYVLKFCSDMLQSAFPHLQP